VGRFPLIAAAGMLRAQSFLIDGEAVACDGDGLPEFDRLRYRRQDGRVFLFAFDLIELNGRDFRREPLEVCKRALAAVLRIKAGAGTSSMTIATTCRQRLSSVRLQARLRGVVSKRLDSAYRSARSRDWLKVTNPNAPAVKREAEEDWQVEVAITMGTMSGVLLRRIKPARPFRGSGRRFRCFRLRARSEFAVVLCALERFRGPPVSAAKTGVRHGLESNRR
jgi:bifunctional non-homologous end joining protein LigD